MRQGVTAIAILSLFLGPAADANGSGEHPAVHSSTAQDRSQPATQTCTWSIVRAPRVPGRADLRAVTAVSADDAWAVGYTWGEHGLYHAISMHWDGAEWTVVDVAQPHQQTFLYGVAAVASDDVWAVGRYFEGDLHSGVLVEHWNGTKWKAVASPWDRSGWSARPVLSGVVAIASDDVWAVGKANVSPSSGHGWTLGEHPIAMRWNGSAWEASSPPDAPVRFFADLTSVSATSGTDVWAAGWHDLTYRWDGAEWRRSQVKGPGGNLNAIAAVAPDDVWALGVVRDFTLGYAQHWDGSGWTDVPVPGGPKVILNGAVALGSSDVWAVGSFGTHRPPTNSTLALHWDGSAWSRIPTPNPNPSNPHASFHGVGADPSGTVWAVGRYVGPVTRRALIERCS